MKPRRKNVLFRTAAAGAIFMALAATLPAAAGEFSYTGSFQLASGSYFFNQTVRGYYFSNGLSFSSGAFSMTAGIPLIYQNTPYVTYSGIGMLPSGGSESSLVEQRRGRETVLLPEPVDSRRYGVGDPLLDLGLRVWEEGGIIPSALISVQAKVPLASLESGFGTGKWDYAAGLSLGKRIHSLFLFADLNYWMLGDLPELELQDTLSYGLSLGLALPGGKAAMLASYSGCTEIIRGAEPPSSVSLGLSLRIGARSNLMLNASFGLSESSPSLALSFGWAVGL